MANPFKYLAGGWGYDQQKNDEKWYQKDWTVGDTQENQDMRDRAMQSLGWKYDERFGATNPGKDGLDGSNFYRVDRNQTKYADNAKQTYDKATMEGQSRLNRMGGRKVQGQNVPMQMAAATGFDDSGARIAAYQELMSRDKMAMNSANASMDWKIRQENLEEALKQQQINQYMKDSAAASKVWGDVGSGVASAVGSMIPVVGSAVAPLLGQVAGKAMGGDGYTGGVNVNLSGVTSALNSASAQPAAGAPKKNIADQMSKPQGMMSKPTASASSTVAGLGGNWYDRDTSTERLG